MLFKHQSQIDHLHPSDALAQIMCNALRNSVVHPLSESKGYVMSFVCEAEKSKKKVCLYRCTMWKAHQGLFNGTVEQLGPITFRLTNLSQQLCCGEKTEFVSFLVRNA